MTNYSESELVLTAAGKVYHLDLLPEDIAHKIILVGDPSRVQLVAKYFDQIIFQTQHREFHTITGVFGDTKISVISTGIGTDNIDIVINELDALANIDLHSRTDKEEKTTLEIIRIGTSGVLHPSVPILSYILSHYSFGLDNVAHFYDIPFSAEEITLKTALENQLVLPKTISPYVTKSSTLLNEKLSSTQTISGITVTASGFYGPQGRQLRIPLATTEMNERLSTFEFEGHIVTNFEMESSALSALGKALGHECTTICLGIANRQTKEFAASYEQEMENLIQYVLERM